MQRFKSYTAKQIIAHLEQRRSAKLLELLAFFKRAHKQETTYQVWEEGNHPQIVESVMRQKLEDWVPKLELGNQRKVVL